MRGIVLRRVRVAVLRIARVAPASIGLPVSFQAFQPDAALARLDHCRAAGLAMQPMPQRVQRLPGHQIGLVQHQQIGGAQLPRHRVRQQGIGRHVADRGGVHQHRHAFELQQRIGQPDLRDARGVGHAAGLDHDPFRRRIQRQHPRQRFVKAAGQRAADAAVGQPQHLPGAVRQQARVHVHRPEVVHQHRRARRSCASAWFSSVVLPAPGNRRPRSAGCVRPLRRPSQASEAIGRPPTTVPHTRASFRRSAGKPRDHPPARRSRHACQPRWSRPDDPCAAYRPRPA